MGRSKKRSAPRSTRLKSGQPAIGSGVVDGHQRISWVDASRFNPWPEGRCPPARVADASGNPPHDPHGGDMIAIPPDAWIETFIAAAQQHGEHSDDLEHEVGDLQDIVRACWAIMSAGQRSRIASDERFADVIADWVR